MTTERFNQLLAGPLRHPMPMFTITRLAMALRVVVEVTGKAGEDALEQYCRKCQETYEWPEDEWPEDDGP